MHSQFQKDLLGSWGTRLFGELWGGVWFGVVLERFAKLLSRQLFHSKVGRGSAYLNS